MASGMITACRESRGKLTGSTSYDLSVSSSSLNFLFIGTSAQAYMYAGIIYTVTGGNTGHFDIAKGTNVDIVNGTNKITVTFDTTSASVIAYYLSIPINGATINS